MIQNHNRKRAELLIMRVTKAYITTIYNNEVRNALLGEEICSVRRAPTWNGHLWERVGQSVCGEVVSL